MVQESLLDESDSRVDPLAVFFVSLTKANKRWVPLKKGILTTSMTNGFSINSLLYGISYVICFEESYENPFHV